MITTLLSSADNILSTHDGPVWPFDEHEILHFDDEQDDVIHMSSESHEESYTLVLIWIG